MKEQYPKGLRLAGWHKNGECDHSKCLQETAGHMELFLKRFMKLDAMNTNKVVFDADEAIKFAEQQGWHSSESCPKTVCAGRQEKTCKKVK